MVKKKIEKIDAKKHVQAEKDMHDDIQEQIPKVVSSQPMVNTTDALPLKNSLQQLNEDDINKFASEEQGGNANSEEQEGFVQKSIEKEE